MAVTTEQRRPAATTAAKAPQIIDDGPAVLVARELVKEYQQEATTQRVLDGVDLEVAQGRFVTVMGPSGSGKSTLLHLLGGLDTPTSGEIQVDGRSLTGMSDDERTKLRRRQIGLVYQFFNLVPVLTAAENIALPAVIAGESERAYQSRLDLVVEMVGLGEHRDKLPNQLSGGQQQRAAIGRALFIEPAIILADEPTGNLDLRTGAGILDLLTLAQAELGSTIVMVTHDPGCAARSDEVLLLREGTFAARLDVNRSVRGAAKTNRGADARRTCVLRWLEKLDAGSH